MMTLGTNERLDLITAAAMERRGYRFTRGPNGELVCHEPVVIDGVLTTYGGKMDFSPDSFDPEVLAEIMAVMGH